MNNKFIVRSPQRYLLVSVNLTSPRALIVVVDIRGDPRTKLQRVRFPCLVEELIFVHDCQRIEHSHLKNCSFISGNLQADEHSKLDQRSHLRR